MGTSPAVAVVLTAPQQQPVQTALTLMRAAIFQRGAAATVRGSLTRVDNGSGTAGAAVTVTFTPPVGASTQVTVTSDRSGHFVAVDPLHLLGNTAVLATVGPELGSASASQTLVVTVHISCSVPAKGVRGAHVVVTCTVPGLAHGSVATLHYSGPAGQRVVIGKVKRGAVAFTFVSPRAQRLKV